MPPIWALLNSNLVIAGIGTIILQYIRNQYQSETRRNTLRMEWLKKNSEEQTKLLNELSHLIASVNTASLILSQGIVTEAVDLITEKAVDSDDEKNDDFEEHQETFTKDMRNWANSILSNIQQRLTGPKFEYHEEHDVLKADQNAFTNSIRNWMNPILSNYYQIQRLTKPKSEKAASLFKAPNIKEELLATHKKTNENLTLATLMQKLQHNTLKLAELLEDLKEQKNHANWNKKTNLNSQIPELSEDEKQHLFFCEFAPFLKKLIGGNKEVLLCEQLERFEGELKTLLLLLCTYQEILNVLESIDKQAEKFFEELNNGFQAHLKTVDDYIA